jgi:hypothetical protein
MSATVTYNVTNETGLDTAIAAADSATAAASYVITLSSDIVLTHSLPVVALAAGASLVMDGTSGPYSLDGGGLGGFVVNAGTVAIDSVTLESFTAGGPGGSGQGGALRVGAGGTTLLSSNRLVLQGGSFGAETPALDPGAANWHDRC